MTPAQPDSAESFDMFRHRLENLINLRHGLCRLARLIDWSAFDREFGLLYSTRSGCPGKPTRLMVGLQYLKHIHGLSDEAVVQRWAENPYWQYFCGEVYFQYEMPIDPSSMTRFRQRIGESGCEFLLKETVDAGVRGKAVKRSDCRRVTVDSTVQEKAVRYPTDGGLLNRSRERLVRLCAKSGVGLRQSYARVGPRRVQRASRYGHARQYRRMRTEIKKVRTYLGRVVRDIERKISGDQALAAIFQQELSLAKRLLVQQRHDKKKLYSVHAPEVECLSKGKVHKRYEFGVKASIAVTNRSNFVVGGQALPGSPYDGHTLPGVLAQVVRMTGERVREVFVDRGYRGHGVEDAQVYLSGQRRGVTTQRLKRCLKRRQAIEPIIGHLKRDGWLGRNHLKGVAGDHMNVVLSCAGHNLRLILNRARFFWLGFRARILAWHGGFQHSVAEIRVGSGRWPTAASTHFAQ